MRRYGAWAATLALAACAAPAPAPVPPPPPFAAELKAPDDLIPALGALQDIRREFDARHLRQPKAERYFRVAGDVPFPAIRNHYKSRLVGWREVKGFPTRTKGGPTAVWSAGGRVFAIVLIPHADRRTEGGGPDQLLLTLAARE